MRDRYLVAALVGLLAMLAVSCGDSRSAGMDGGEIQRVTVDMSELKYEPMRLSVRAGQPVEVTARNVGTTDHDFVISGLPAKDVKSVRAGHGGHDGGSGEIVGHAKPKQTIMVRFTPLQAGDFEIFCSLPGHKEGGMTGLLAVT